MEVLLLDTTEKEGEDNALYHYAQPSSTGETTRGLDLRGVLAAAAGTTASLCGEPLRCVRFGRRAPDDDCAGVAGVVDMGDVLYVLVFPDGGVPTAVIQYYARSSCDLLLSLLGFPDRRLQGWRQRNDGVRSVEALAGQLDAVFHSVVAIIQRDRSFQSHLHFVFAGRVPAVNYPLETMAELAMLETPLEDPADCSRGYSVIGRCIFFRKQLVFSTMRSDMLQLLFQWLLDVDSFSTDCSAAKQATHQSEKASTRSTTYVVHDFRFARHGVYPRRHALLVITTRELQMVFLVERDLHFDSKSDGQERTWADRLQEDVDWEHMQVLVTICYAHLAPYLAITRGLREERAQALRTTLRLDLQRNNASSTGFLWYSVVLDRLRGVLLGDELPGIHKADSKHDNQEGDTRQPKDQQHLWAVLSCFVDRLADLQQTLHRTLQSPVTPSPELPSGIPPLKLAVDDCDALFLREQLREEAGTDISTGGARIFPALQRREHADDARQAVQQVAERIVIDGQTLWIVASSFETLDAFAVLDAALPLEQLLAHELNRLCAFGGAVKTETTSARPVAGE